MIFVEWLNKRLVEISKDLKLDDFTFEVANEQDFIKPNLSENKICVVVKNLTASRVYTTLIQPMQIMVISEQNGLEVAQIIFMKLSAMYNYWQEKEGNTAYKFQIGNPAVLNNFNVIGAGLRSVLYVGVSLIITENICDISNLYIDGAKIDIISASIGYGANMDTVQFPDYELADSVKASGSLTMSIVVSCQDIAFVQKALYIMFGQWSGNMDYTFSFKIGGSVNIADLKMKQQSCTFATAINDVPSIVIGFSK